MWKNFKGRLVHIVTYWLTKNLLKAVHEDELLVQTNRGWYIGKHRLSDAEMAALSAEAKDFRDSYLWKMIRKDVQFVAYLRSQAKARTDGDLIYGSAMYYNIELIQKFIERCESL